MVVAIKKSDSMKMKYLLLCMTLGLSLIPIGSEAQGTYKKIVNELYSINIPSNWIIMDGTPENGKTPGKRSTKEYNIRYLGWYLPFEAKDDFRLTFDIQSYQRKNKSPLTESDIEKMELERLKGFKVEHLSYSKTLSKHNQIRLSLVKTTSEHDNSIVAYRRFYLIKKGKDMVHRLMLSVPEVQYKKKNSDIQKAIDCIFNSFTGLK